MGGSEQSSLTQDTEQNKRRSWNLLNEGVLVLLVALLTAQIFLYGAQLFGGAATKGVCTSISLSTLDAPTGLSITSGVLPCDQVPIKEVRGE